MQFSTTFKLISLAVVTNLAFIVKGTTGQAQCRPDCTFYKVNDCPKLLRFGSFWHYKYVDNDNGKQTDYPYISNGSTKQLGDARTLFAAVTPANQIIINLFNPRQDGDEDAQGFIFQFTMKSSSSLVPNQLLLFKVQRGKYFACRQEAGFFERVESIAFSKDH